MSVIGVSAAFLLLYKTFCLFDGFNVVGHLWGVFFVFMNKQSCLCFMNKRICLFILFYFIVTLETE